MSGRRQDAVVILMALVVIAGALWSTTGASAGVGDSVTGTVIYAPAGTTIEGAVVVLIPSGATTASDATGAYTFSNVPDGNHTVAATFAGGFADNPQGIVVAAASVAVPALTFGATEFLFCDAEITSECLKSLVVNGATNPSDVRAVVSFVGGLLQMQILGFDGTDTIDGSGFPFIDLGAARSASVRATCSSSASNSPPSTSVP